MQSEQFAAFRRLYGQVVHNLDSIRLRQWEELRVTLPQLRVLYAVRQRPGTTTGEMARLLGISVSTTSGLVIKLVDRGLLTRTTLPEDRRQEPLFLTETGEALVGELLTEGRSFLDRVAEQLGDDLPEVLAALSRLAEASGDVRTSPSSALPQRVGGEGSIEQPLPQNLAPKMVNVMGEGQGTEPGQR